MTIDTLVDVSVPEAITTMNDCTERGTDNPNLTPQGFECPHSNPLSNQPNPAMPAPDSMLYTKLLVRMERAETIFERLYGVDSVFDIDLKNRMPKADCDSKRPFCTEYDILYVSDKDFCDGGYKSRIDHVLVVAMESHAAAPLPPQDCSTTGSGKLTSIDTKLGDDVLQRVPKLPGTTDSTLNDSNIIQIPTRLRIMDKYLQDEINRITGTVQLTYQARPFRSLVHFEKEFKQRLQRQEIICEEMIADEQSSFPSSAVNKRCDSVSLLQNKTEAHKSTARGSNVLQAQNLRDSLQCLVHFLHVTLKDIMEVRQRIQAGDLTAISFDHLGYLFSTGEQIISTEPKEQLYRVLQVFGRKRFVENDVPSRDEVDTAYNPRAKISDLIIDAFYIDFDGKKFGAVPKRIVISPYDGLRNVVSLKAYPLRFHPLRAEVGEKLTARGGKFVKSIQDMHKKYSGLTTQEGDGYLRKEEIDSDVIIDFELAFRKSDPLIASPKFDSGGNLIPTLPNIRGINSGYRGFKHLFEDDVAVTRLRTGAFLSKTKLLDPQPVGKLSKDSLRLLPYRLYGYALLNRKWFPLDVDLVHDVEQVQERDTDGFNELVLPQGHKDIVRALINMHARTPGPDFAQTRHVHTSTRHTDLVKGKGKGLVILLHGAPGVGKTSTAECVAANTDRPLLPITCGDISGVSVKEVEQKLEGYFDLPRKWGCVLLLDEADVFLSERIKGDIKQNSLVLVFLRALEYYSGILILTTNRVGEFDEAIKSRIHCTLYYPPLDEDNTMKIWETNLDRLDYGNKKNMSGPPINFDRKEIMRFAKKHWKAAHPWNGRQIKNAFQTAIALAEWDNLEVNRGSQDELTGPILKKRHFKIVAAASAHFDIYLQHVRTSDQQRARTRELRRDDVREMIEADSPPAQTKRRAKTKTAAYPQQQPYPLNAHSDSESTDTSSESDEDTDEEPRQSKARRQEKLQGKEREEKKRQQREDDAKAERKRSSKKEKGRRNSSQDGKHKTHRTGKLTAESTNEESNI
ncbi:hypothetical protein MMC17_008234 [Xylographa soralifera]|nr:hypothetical protein [Xylographa soralifera]